MQDGLTCEDGSWKQLHHSQGGQKQCAINPGQLREQARFLRRQFLQDGELPCSHVLSEALVSQALTTINTRWLDRLYSPLVTLWVFLGQVLSADPSCRAAVARLIAHRISRGHDPCSGATGAYCQARKRLPEAFFASIARQAGQALETTVDAAWLWKRRRVYVYDGSAVSMPDTPENQRVYPQPGTQKPGLGFPLARVAVPLVIRWSPPGRPSRQSIDSGPQTV